MSSQAHAGQTALENRDYPKAIELLTLAINKDGPTPTWLFQRSTAYQRSGQYKLALVDADNATIMANARNRRELIATAQLRRAVALHAMGRYGDARLCFNWSFKKNEKEKGLTMWMGKCKADYEKAGGEDAECNKTTVKEIPDKVEEVGSGSNTKAKPVNKENVALVKAAAPKVLAATQKEKIRHEWYQSPSTVTIEVLAKGVPKDKAEVVIEEGSVSCPSLNSKIDSC